LPLTNTGSEEICVDQKAIAYQRQQTPNPDNHEWLAMRLLLNVSSVGEDVAKLRQQLLDARNATARGVERRTRRCLTTGLAIYVLAKVRAGDDSSVFRDARNGCSRRSNPTFWLTPARIHEVHRS